MLVGEKLINECKVCGKKISKLKSFCSRTCSKSHFFNPNYKNFSNISYKNCKFCGNMFTFNSNLTTNFCSVICRAKYIGKIKLEKRIETKCLNCGKIITNPKYYSNRKYCNRTCMGNSLHFKNQSSARLKELWKTPNFYNIVFNVQSNKKRSVSQAKYSKEHPEKNERFSIRMKQEYLSGKRTPNFNCCYSNVGYRKDLGHYVRSSLESNICRVLKYLHIEYEYEKTRYLLSNNTVYIPDFYLPQFRVYIEAKARKLDYDNPIFSKCYMFSKEYPDKDLHIVDSKEYSTLRKEYKYLITGWEGD
jgi:hypothetical protein